MDINQILLAIIKLLHVAAAAVWFGGGLYAYMLTKADLAGDFGLSVRYNAMVTRVSRLPMIMPVAAISTTVIGIILYILAGYYNRGFGTLGSIIFHIGVLAGIAATVHGATAFGRAARQIQDLTERAVNADGSVNAEPLQELNAAQTAMGGMLNVHFTIVAVAFACMVLGTSII